MQDKNLTKLWIVIGKLCVCAIEFRKYYFREVVESRFATISFMKSHNSHTYYPITSESEFMLYKYTLRAVLHTRFRMFKHILKSYGSIVKLEYSTKGISYNRLRINNLKKQSIDYIR